MPTTISQGLDSGITYLASLREQLPGQSSNFLRQVNNFLSSTGNMIYQLIQIKHQYLIPSFYSQTSTVPILVFTHDAKQLVYMIKHLLKNN